MVEDNGVYAGGRFTAFGEAGPAVGTGDETDVDDQADGKEIVSNSDGDGGANKTPTEMLWAVRFVAGSR